MAEEKVQISLRVPSGIVAGFDQLAGLLDRDRSWVMVRALSRYLEEEGADIRDDAEGLAELQQGLGSDIDEVLAKARAIISEAESRHIRRAG